MTNQPIVLIESPYRNGDRNANLRYLAWCEFHAASIGEVPIASHGNCTAYWPETEEYRAKGFAWRDRIRSVCAYVVYYMDLGLSHGAQQAKERDVLQGIHTVERRLPEYLLREFQAGCYPPGTMRRVAV